jgi:hypothetical protein
MALPNIFSAEVLKTLNKRINQLTPESIPLWGKMNVSQMLAHCNVPYEMVYTDKHPQPNAFVGFVIALLAKKAVVNEKPYPKNSRTAPQFIIKGERDFEIEKRRLVDYLEQTQKLGEKHFDGLSSNSFGNLTTTEWNNLFYKHLDHHLTQFGV